MSQKEIHTQYTPKQYLSGIYRNEFVKPGQAKEIHFFAIDLETNKGIDPIGHFSIVPDVIDENIISFEKIYQDLPYKIIYSGEKQNHPVPEPPYAATYKVDQNKVTGKSILVLSNNLNTIFELPSINAVGIDIVHPSFLRCNIVIPEEFSAIIPYGQTSRRQSQQNRFSL